MAPFRETIKLGSEAASSGHFGEPVPPASDATEVTNQGRLQRERITRYGSRG